MRTTAGIVTFTDGTAHVDDAELAAALREVPDVFGIAEEGGAKGPSSSPARPARSSTNRRRTKED
ncbi:hypothetical protein [Thermomonospora cellulosilytica]|uniref:Uncharacterized protein n=1 Tax=Thermomonospora cellulosilytica TaxID=1411118 RepID=A0A7W3MXH7_9ACTN|nr:hypothetical protein [Thermomonospora cellulosilytica]MBA9003738.1 hypothetical protein [Thermomonospora cellulosilytica]